MSAIRVACQTYTWEMLGEEWHGQVTDILDWIADAGYAGVEITNNMIGKYYDQPGEFDAELQKRGLKLAAFAYSAASGFTDANCREEYLGGALKAIGFLRDFPEPRLGLAGAAHPERDNVWEKLDQAIKLYNRVGGEAAAAGVSVMVHPHSHFGSLLESAEEYQYLLDHLDPTNVSFGPDTGHIVRGGQDLLVCLQTHMPRITHLHLKDATPARDWVP